jgi:hypothetical protein
MSDIADIEIDVDAHLCFSYKIILIFAADASNSNSLDPSDNKEQNNVNLANVT